jgi:hypothetical protein
MEITVPVDMAECFRRGIEHYSDNLVIDIAPSEVTEEERRVIAGRLDETGVFKRAGWPYFPGICPPTKEEFLRVIREWVSGISESEGGKEFDY